MAWPNKCEQCGNGFESQKAWAKYCTTKCRNAAARDRKRAAAKEIAQHTDSSGMELGQLEEFTRTELVETGRENSVLGQAALMMARALDRGLDQGLPAIARGIAEHRVALHVATLGAKGEPEDELAKLRQNRTERNGPQRGGRARRS